MNKAYYIKLFRNNGFNCFPIPKYPDAYLEHKAADLRYQGVRTKINQPITEEENYGVIAIKGAGTCFIDLDHKENYRSFAEENIKNGHMVIETPNGWHIPIKNLGGEIQKVMLYDYGVEPTKQIVEIQGHDHYVIGVSCEIMDKKTKQKVSYKSVGSDKIFDAKGKDFHDFVDFLCKRLGVISGKRSSRSAHRNMRIRFLEGKPPTKGTSNDYFYNAAIQCLTDKLTIGEAIEKIKTVYDNWRQTPQFSGREWRNIEAKIEDAYENGEPLREGRPKGGGGDIDTVTIAQNIIGDRKIYSNLDTGDVYENTSGFLEKITKTLQRELQIKYPVLKEAEYKDVIFKLKGLALEMPETNTDLIVFKNGVYDIQKGEMVETDEIADMGFKDYDYLPSGDKPEQFLKVMFGDIPDVEIPRVNAGLKAIFRGKLDSRISVIHGDSGVGKSTGTTILDICLGDYSMLIELDQFLDDHFIRAKIIGKRLLVFQELPQTYKDFATIKTITGETRKSERGFHKDMEKFDNKLKIWATGNYLAKIPEKEKDAMYTRRLSLIHNIRHKPYPEDSGFADRVAKEEGEKIISWIINLPEDECKYEDRNTVRKEWEYLASPEIDYLENYYEFDETADEKGVIRLVRDFQQKYQKDMSIDIMEEALKKQGYSVRNQIVKYCKLLDKPKHEAQSKL